MKPELTEPTRQAQELPGASALQTVAGPPTGFRQAKIW